MTQTVTPMPITELESHLHAITINANPITARREIVPDKLDDQTLPHVAYAHRLINTYTILSTPATQLLTDIAANHNGESVTVSSTGALAVVKGGKVVSFIAPKHVVSHVAPFVKKIVDAILTMNKSALSEFTDVKSQVRDLGLLALAVVKASEGYTSIEAAALRLAITGYFVDTVKLLKFERADGEVTLRIKERSERVSVNNESIMGSFRIFKNYECAIVPTDLLVNNNDDIGSVRIGKKVKSGEKVIRTKQVQTPKAEETVAETKPMVKTSIPKEKPAKLKRTKIVEEKEPVTPIAPATTPIPTKKEDVVPSSSSDSDEVLKNEDFKIGY